MPQVGDPPLASSDLKGFVSLIRGSLLRMETIIGASSTVIIRVLWQERMAGLGALPALGRTCLGVVVRTAKQQGWEKIGRSSPSIPVNGNLPERDGRVTLLKTQTTSDRINLFMAPRRDSYTRLNFAPSARVAYPNLEAHTNSTTVTVLEKGRGNKMYTESGPQLTEMNSHLDYAVHGCLRDSQAANYLSRLPSIKDEILLDLTNVHTSSFEASNVDPIPLDSP
ncbi:hypothetical protein GLOTRDRAFT_93429 [Gloeophyllum trabeum ATCC 11539]|uniref:Uncharacterized protein n=1 Tax=Gloeophyllum trabeum (strain ATCC 11539 / FP-39264 / Madison 617) TaxID=670483 RepID=S7RN65_GLOTA|nr:uncharacterized protein GLOTRDRAFT_93429 [Gloeophyllum trabeum ATCC 11539]EPQ55905.1 hypothetical protein GLOTRDRAFT_93429 [Gloeophyllum trabeum ATCC 11539]